MCYRPCHTVCILTSHLTYNNRSKKEDRIGHWMTPKNKGFLDGFPANPSLSVALLNDKELNYYVREYGRHSDGFYNSLFWYQTWRMNWENDEKIPVPVTQPALMVW
jgi:hypothetical protein